MTNFLHPAQMRRFLTDHNARIITVVEAFEECFGLKPNPLQIMRANMGGMNDRRTILSLPDQVCAWRRIMHQVRPVFRIKDEVLVRQIKIGPFNERQMINLHPRTVQNMATKSETRMFWRKEPLRGNVHPIDTAFIVHLGRYIEPGGFEYYGGRIERGEMSLPEAVAEIANSREARMLLGEGVGDAP